MDDLKSEASVPVQIVTKSTNHKIFTWDAVFVAILFVAAVGTLFVSSYFVPQNLRETSNPTASLFITISFWIGVVAFLLSLALVSRKEKKSKMVGIILTILTGLFLIYLGLITLLGSIVG